MQDTMSIIAYCRVSTRNQADKDLSIPAQLHAMQRFAEQRGTVILQSFSDTASGRSLKSRPGLLQAVRAYQRDDVEMLLVHRLDRISRSMHGYLSIKAELRKFGVRLVSVVEQTDESPMGQFVERLLAAQAELYSENLALEVKKGMKQRLRNGRWHGVAPVGYLNRHGTVVVDPARAQFVRQAFQAWSTGRVTSTELADRLHKAGFVSRQGKRISASRICGLLKNHFYYGLMVVSGRQYQGIHPPLITKALFEECQEVFRQKNSGGKPRRKLHFLLSRKISCPKCYTFLIGEEHRKPSGKIYRYYRCHQRGCGFCIRAEDVEEAVVGKLISRDVESPFLALLPMKEENEPISTASHGSLRRNVREFRNKLIALEQAFLESLRTRAIEHRSAKRQVELILFVHGDMSEGVHPALIAHAQKKTKRRLPNLPELDVRGIQLRICTGKHLNDKVDQRIIHGVWRKVFGEDIPFDVACARWKGQVK